MNIMNISNWITGLMRENYEAVGFIPMQTIEQRYIKLHRYILQIDEHGHPVGYLLHGALQCGHPAIVSQHVIEYEKRLKGHGQAAFRELLNRCIYAGATSIQLRCADNLPSNDFWISCGFKIASVSPGGIARGRNINQMVKLLPLGLWHHNMAV